MLIYGESGSGKTRICGSADNVPEMRRVLLIDAEGGTLTLRDTYPNVETVRVRTWQELQSVYDELYIGKHDYTTVILDSLTEIQKMNMDSVMDRAHDDRDIEVPEVREWNINIEQTRKFVRAYRNLPMNTIFTALAIAEKNPQNGKIKRKPSLSGKVKDEVAGFLDVVVYLYVKEIDQENKRMLLCGQTEDTVAKDRSNLLPLTIENPTMSIVWEFLNNRELVNNGNES
jgi:phage nucleotide-binding protein